MDDKPMTATEVRALNKKWLAQLIMQTNELLDVLR